MDVLAVFDGIGLDDLERVAEGVIEIVYRISRANSFATGAPDGCLSRVVRLPGVHVGPAELAQRARA